SDMDEMNVQPVDVGYKLRQMIQSCFDLAPVIPVLPIAGEGLHRFQSHALSGVCYRFLFRPFGGGDAVTQVDKCLLCYVNPERTDGCVCCCGDQGPGVFV